MNFLSVLVSIGVGLLLLCESGAYVSAAEIVPQPAVMIRQVKITGDEFVVLQSTQDVNLGDFWLGYSSTDTAASIVPTQQLPAQQLRAGQAVLLTSDGAPTCDAVLVAKLSFSLSDSKGTLAVRQLMSSGATSTFTTVDTVNWSKPTAAATTTDNLDLRLETTIAINPVWFHMTTATGWRVGSFMNCTLSFSANVETPATSIVWPPNDSEPPSIIESLADETSSAGPSIPAADIGLLPPQITELLPNPSGTGTDSTNEFIELYNPNGAIFDLSGFTMRTGLTTKRSYVFPAGTTLAPKAFVAFYAADTGLSLSNTGSQVDLQDPFGVTIAQSDAYSSAKDGMAWALAKGSWYWTNKSSPGAANTINQASAKNTAIVTTSPQKAVAAVKGAATETPALVKTVSTATQERKPASIHPIVLAAVVLIGVGYVIYEYRQDIANTFHKLRADRKNR